MKYFWPMLLSIIAGLSTMLGSVFIFFPIKNVDKFITFCLSLSMSIMLGISVFDLIPEAIKCLSSISSGLSFLLILTIFFLGVLIAYIINKTIEKEKGSSSLYKVGLLSFLALVLHNLPEGILTFMSTYKDFNLGFSICIAIALHNIPEGISISVPLFYSTGSKWKAINKTLLSSVAEPFGAVLAFMLFKNYITDELIGCILVLVSGIMVSISIESILPEVLSYKLKKPVYAGVIVGLIVIILNLIL